MPIRAENKHRYPRDWKQIVETVRVRSGNRCEGSPAYPDCRAENYQPHPVTGSNVVLTTAHLNHTPEDCEMSNLKHWCQRCHITYDAPMKAAGIKQRRNERLGQAVLI